MTSKFSIDNRELLQRISSGEAVVGIDFGNLIVRELAAFRLAAMDSEPDCNERKLFCSTDTARMRKVVSASDGSGTTPLYHRAAMLQAGNSPVIPEGYVMVPKEPTAEMQSAGASAIRIETTALNKLWTGNAVFRAMLAASPQEDINALIPLVSRNEREVK